MPAFAQQKKVPSPQGRFILKSSLIPQRSNRRRVLLHPNGDGRPPGEKRQEIASRMLKRGYRPDIALEQTQEGLAELERRLDRIELEEKKATKLSQ